MTEAQPLKEFLERQRRAATEKDLQIAFGFRFADGLALGGDMPEKIAERLTRFASGAAHVMASAERQYRDLPTAPPFTILSTRAPKWVYMYPYWVGLHSCGRNSPSSRKAGDATMLAHVLDAMLGTTTKIRILRTLFALGSAATGNEARGLARVRSVRAMYAALDELTSLGILLREETRGPHLYRVNRDHHLAEPLAAVFEAESRRAGEVRTALRSALDAAGHLPPVVSMVLYGSNARGEAGPASDLDVLVITRDEETVSPVRDTLLSAFEPLERRFGLRLSAYVLPEPRVRDRYRDGDPLMLTIESEGRELHGTPFPELVQGW